MLAVSEKQSREGAQALALHAQLRIMAGVCAKCGLQTETLQLTRVGAATVERASPEDLGSSDPLCPVCLEPIRASDKVRGSGDDLMHEGCDDTRPAASTRPPRAT
jgi:hypothetical protein